MSEAWDELYGRLFGRATAAYIDLRDSRTTQRRFGVQFSTLPEVFYISKGFFYRYNVERDQEGNPVLSVDDLEKFVNE